MSRTIIVGDLHGCRDELAALLDHVGISRGDDLVCVGDLVVRGPDPAGTLDLLMKLNARSVRGNHEDRVLRVRSGEMRPGEQQKATIAALKPKHWEYLERLPLWIELPEHGVRIVHAGLMPGVPIERQAPRHLMYLRTLGESLEPSEKRGDRAWGRLYGGPPHVVFGHNALPEPQLHAWATGVDTGCVYGGRLTAMVLRAGERVPPPKDRRAILVSVPARRRYAGS
jgi:hypothetical protein